MRDLRELAQWFAARDNVAHTEAAESLPDPAFHVRGRRVVSFSSNNYLALATSPRLKARAHAARCEQQHREALAIDLVGDGRAVTLEHGHGSIFL